MGIIILFILSTTFFTINSYYISDYSKPGIIQNGKNNHKYRNIISNIKNHYNKPNFNTSSLYKPINSFIIPVNTYNILKYMIINIFYSNKVNTNNHIKTIQNKKSQNYDIQTFTQNIQPYRQLWVLSSTVLLACIFLFFYIYVNSYNSNCCTFI